MADRDIKGTTEECETIRLINPSNKVASTTLEVLVVTIIEVTNHHHSTEPIEDNPPKVDVTHNGILDQIAPSLTMAILYHNFYVYPPTTTHIPK